jgi:hypothetical protein
MIIVPSEETVANVLYEWSKEGMTFNIVNGGLKEPTGGTAYLWAYLDCYRRNRYDVKSRAAIGNHRIPHDCVPVMAGLTKAQCFELARVLLSKIPETTKA